MPDHRFKNCKGCGKPSAEVGPLSWTRLCRSCGMARIEANNDQMSAGTGPYFERNQRRTLMEAQRRLLAAEREKG